MLQQQHNATNQLLALPGMNNGTNLSTPGSTVKAPRPWWRRTRNIVIALVLLAVLAIGLLYTLLNRQAPPTYQYAPVTQGNLSLTVQATGPLQSPATYNLVAPTNGIIQKIDVRVGQRVTTGQTLAELDKTALQDAVNEAQATVNADEDALYNLEVSTGWVVTPTVIQAQDTLNIARTQLTAAQHNLDSTTLHAPHAGTVIAINGTVGSTPGLSLNASSTSAGSFFIQIIDLSSLQIAANVNESDTANLKIGDAVQFTVDAYGDRQFSGTVKSISSNGVASSNVVSFPVMIDVNTRSIQGVNLLPGMTASVTITVLQQRNVLQVPVSAISFARSNSAASGGDAALVSQQEMNAALGQARLMLTNLQSQNPTIAAESPSAAFVIERSNSTYIAKPVVLGITDGTSYEVLNGLSPNEAVLVGTGGSGQNSNTAPSNNGSNSSGKSG